MCTFIDLNTAFAILLLTARLGRSQSQALLTIFEVCVHVCLITVAGKFCPQNISVMKFSLRLISTLAKDGVGHYT